MTSIVLSFNELRAEYLDSAGGKGGMLAKLYQSGYPVPEGFVILPAAFSGDSLTEEAWKQVQSYLQNLLKRNVSAGFAVRSSALSEDSAQASFAGEFETVLDVHTDDAILAAIHTVQRSRRGERAKAYSKARGMQTHHKMSVVVQQFSQSSWRRPGRSCAPLSPKFTRSRMRPIVTSPRAVLLTGSRPPA